MSSTVALVSAFLQLTGCVIKAFARVFYITPLLVLSDPTPLRGFGAEQLPSLALVLFDVNDQGAAMALAFFGFATALNGYLILNSGFLPRWLGLITLVAGFGWLAFVYPPLGQAVFTVVALFALIVSVATVVVLVVGFDEANWREQAGAGAAVA